MLRFFHKLKARPSASITITTCFIAVIWNELQYLRGMPASEANRPRCLLGGAMGAWERELKQKAQPRLVTTCLTHYTVALVSQCCCGHAGTGPGGFCLRGGEEGEGIPTASPPPPNLVAGNRE